MRWVGRVIVGLLSLAVVAGVSTPASATTINLITNGDFETGTLAGWVQASTGPCGGNACGPSGFYAIANGGSGPDSAQPTLTLTGGGSFIALGDQDGVSG